LAVKCRLTADRYDPHMGLGLIPDNLRQRYRFEERNHACGILASDYPEQWNDLLTCLDAFVLRRTAIVQGGGARSPIPKELDGFLYQRNWGERKFDVRIVVDDADYPTPTHAIDNVKNGIGVEVEWNNKTEFFDRDLNNFRLLHDLHVIDVGVIITRVTELQHELFKPLDIGGKYGASTTHWDKLIPKVNGGGAGGCPLLLVGITKACYDPKA